MDTRRSGGPPADGEREGEGEGTRRPEEEEEEVGGTHGKEPKPVSDRATQYMRETVLFCRGSAGSSRRPSARRITKSSRGALAGNARVRLVASAPSLLEEHFGKIGPDLIRAKGLGVPRSRRRERAPKGSVRGSTLTLSAPAVLAAPAVMDRESSPSSS